VSRVFESVSDLPRGVGNPPADSPGSGSWLAGVFSALPDFGLAFAFLTTWISPGRLGDHMISYLMLLMLLEFIIVHSSGFMAGLMVSDVPRGKKTLWLFGLSCFYMLFVGAFALAFGTWWPLSAFWLLTLNRLSGVLLGQAPVGRESQMVMASWAVGALAYLLLAFATTLLPVPRLGITKAVVAAEHLPGTGLWVDEPQRVIAFGFLYFTVVALWELGAHAWVSRGRAGSGASMAA
jgi:hypothetical protein